MVAQIQPNGYEPYGLGPGMKYSSNGDHPYLDQTLLASEGLNVFYSGNVEAFGFQLMLFGSLEIDYSNIVEKSLGKVKLTEFFFNSLSTFQPNHYVTHLVAPIILELKLSAKEFGVVGVYLLKTVYLEGLRLLIFQILFVILQTI